MKSFITLWYDERKPFGLLMVFLVLVRWFLSFVQLFDFLWLTVLEFYAWGYEFLCDGCLITLEPELVLSAQTDIETAS